MYSETLSLVIDPAKCNACGACISECVNMVLTRDPANGRVVIAENGADRCIHCAPCMMVCPPGALSIDGIDPDSCEKITPGADFQSLLANVKKRRSVRHFKNRNVEDEVMADLLDALRYPPTGVNFRNLRFTVITDRTIMEKYRTKFYDACFALMGKDPETKKQADLWREMIRKGGDPVFRTAPHLILVNYKEDAPCGLPDAVIALSYFEMLANAAEVGTVWFGRLIMLFRQYPELMEMFRIAPGYQPGYAMLFGYAANLFRRSVKRDLPEISILD